jgi:ligand-binding SRPBCC domain-containing protein
MSVEFTLYTEIAAPCEVVWAVSLSIDAHLASMSASGERVLVGVSSGQIGLGETVTWRARHFGVPWTMTSRITELRSPDWFVDEEVRGPFHSFRHEHRFTAIPGGSTMEDHVHFVAPLGVLGRAVEAVILGRYLRKLIIDRNAFLKKALEADPPLMGEAGSFG